MTTEPTLPTTCDEVRELAPDVALGLLTGEVRAAALAHLERCGACRAEVAGLASAADEVLLLAPEATPPAGFADRVLDRIAELAGTEVAAPASALAGDGTGARRGAGGTASRWRRARPLLAAAAALVVLAGVLGLALARSRDAAPPATPVATAEMRTGRGRTVGEVAVSGAGPATVEVQVPEWDALVDRWGTGPSGDYHVAIELHDGTRLLRPVPDAGGGDAWTFTVEAPAEAVAAVSVVDVAGRVWCSGRLLPV